MLRKNLLLIIVICTLCLANNRIFAQEEDYSKEPEKTKNPKVEKMTDRFLFGGGGGLQFGDQMNISLMPRIGYYVTDKLIGGVGIDYIYEKINYDHLYGQGGIFETSIFGGSVFGEYFLLDNAFVHVEPEFINYEFFDNYLNKQREWVSSFFVGGGFAQHISEKGFLGIMLLYNLNYSTNSPYASPWVIRINLML